MMKKTGLYIHIPFCVRKCNYCAFLSFNAQSSPRKEYTDALCEEIRRRAVAYGSKTGSKAETSEKCDCRSAKPVIDTVYVGGGTPSVLDVSQMRDIMHAVKTSFEIKPDAEITIEVNPGTLGAKDGVTRAKLTAYRSMGFNRISMGVQSMDNDTLQFLGRIHTAENVVRDVRLIREAGFENLNLDLIFSIPNDSGRRLVYADSKGTGKGTRYADEENESCDAKEDFGDCARERALSDARQIIALEPEHISCYSLQIEEGTPFAERIESGEISEVSDEEDRETYHAVCELMRNAGYEHYEISNFARIKNNSDKDINKENDRSPYQSRHNSLYWDMSDYIGAGLGASGFVNGVRYKNISDIEKYIEAYSSVEKIRQSSGNIAVSQANGAGDFEFPLEEEHRNTAFDNISEAVFTGLRRRKGITYEEALAAYERSEALTDRANCSGTESKSDTIIGETDDKDDKTEKERFWEIFAEAKPEAISYVNSGHLIMDERGLRLSERGIDISNGIMALFV